MGAFRELPSVNPLFQPFKFGEHDLAHRMVYAPLTRCRSKGHVPQPAAVEYYAQRTTRGGLLLSEATAVTTAGIGYRQVPGIWSDEQVEAWKPIVQAVHERGGVFFLQLWHVGRASLPAHQNGVTPVGPSAIAISTKWKANDPDGKEAEYPVPRALDKSELPGIVNEFVVGARNAIRAGFDGVEIHGANGYIIDQFLKSQANQRTDEYGGSTENKARFALEIAKAVAEEVGPQRVGFRISPYSDFLDATDPDTVAINVHLATGLSQLGLLYLHGVEGRIAGSDDADDKEGETLQPFRDAFKGVFLAAGGFKREQGIEALSKGRADLIVYGRLFLANPDLPERFLLEGTPLNKYDRTTFYTPDLVKGYTDYPYLEEVDPKAAARVKELIASNKTG